MSTPPRDDKPALARAVAADPDAPGTPLRAILTGLAIDIGGSFVVDLVAGTLYVLSVASAGLSEDQVNAALAQMPPESAFAVLSMIGRALCSVAAGFACARIVQRSELRFGGLMGVILALLSLLADGEPDGLLELATATTLACNLLGVKYGREANERRRALKAAVAEDAPAP